MRSWPIAHFLSGSIETFHGFSKFVTISRRVLDHIQTCSDCYDTSKFCVFKRGARISFWGERDIESVEEWTWGVPSSKKMLHYHKMLHFGAFL